ncbi:MAG: adenylate/guanylate cyclase domain-containing protein, partial [Candidatus Delongbacteria bacterium]|nr:adenylate/guanylate cyclase domain-containing protein [Candidatus Delongbacteria bacterium]
MEDNTTRKLRAIMFTDIVGYTTLMQHDETEALKLLQKHKDLVKDIVEKFGGKIIKHIGDEILIESESAVMLVYSAQELQKKLSERNASVPKSRELWVRIGIHIGDVVFQDNDIFGDGVNIASRLRPLAEPGGICVSHAVIRLLGNQNEIKTSFLGLKKLKNIDEKIKVYNVQVDTSYQPTLSSGKPTLGESDSSWLKYVLYSLAAIFVGVILYFTLFKSKYADYELDYFRGDFLSAYEKTSDDKELDEIKEHYFHILSATGLQGEKLKQEYRSLAKSNPYSSEAIFYLGLTYSLFSTSESQIDSSIYLFNLA